MTGENMDLYDIVRSMRDRSWTEQRRRFGEWEPASDAPEGDVAMFWYLQGKAEAYAAIMSEIESGVRA